MIILRILRFLWQVPVLLVTVSFQYFWWMIRYSRHPEKYPLELRYRRVHKVIRWVLKVFRIRYNIEGLEQLDNINAQYLMVPNHRSNLDPLVVLAVVDKPITFVAKQEIRKYPIIGRCVRALQGVFLDRGDLRQQLRTMKVVEEDMLSGHRNWVIFPEGTRNKKEDITCLLPFHHGSFRVPMNNDFHIVPLAMIGTNRIISRKYMWRTDVTLKFCKPFKPSEIKNVTTSQELAVYTQNIVHESLIELSKIDYTLVKQARKAKK